MPFRMLIKAVLITSLYLMCNPETGFDYELGWLKWWLCCNMYVLQFLIKAILGRRGNPGKVNNFYPCYFRYQCGESECIFRCLLSNINIGSNSIFRFTGVWASGHLVCEFTYTRSAKPTSTETRCTVYTVSWNKVYTSSKQTGVSVYRGMW